MHPKAGAFTVALGSRRSLPAGGGEGTQGIRMKKKCTLKGCLTLCGVKHPFRVPSSSTRGPSVDAPASTLGYGESTRFGVHLDLRSMKTIGVSELSSVKRQFKNEEDRLYGFFEENNPPHSGNFNPAVLRHFQTGRDMLSVPGLMRWILESSWRFFRMRSSVVFKLHFFMFGLSFCL